MKKFALIGLSLWLITGCSQGLNQDPLKDYPDNVRGGVAPEDMQRKPDRNPFPKDGVRIDLNEVVEFSEEQEVSVEFSVKTYVPLNSFELELEKQSELFPGSKLEEIEATPKGHPTERKYKFTWTAPLGITGETPYAVRPMTLRVIFDKGARASQEQFSKALINRHFKVPKIVSAGFAQSSILETEKTDLVIEVQDLDSLPQASPAVSPTIRFESTPKPEIDGSVYLKGKTISPDKKTNAEYDSTTNTWKLYYEFSTQEDDEITDDQQFLRVDFSAISRFGTKSATSSLYMFINNNLKDPISSLAPNQTVSFVKGVSNSTSFTVFDQKLDGDVTAVLKTDAKTLPGTLALNCLKTVPGKKSMANCTLAWSIPSKAVVASAVPLVIEITNKGRSAGRVVTKSALQTLNIFVTDPTPSSSSDESTGSTTTGGGNP